MENVNKITKLRNLQLWVESIPIADRQYNTNEWGGETMEVSDDIELAISDVNDLLDELEEAIAEASQVLEDERERLVELTYGDK